MIALRLTHPALDFWVDVRITEFRGTWCAVADLANSPEMGVSRVRELALLFALWPLGANIAWEMAGSRQLPAGRASES
jgi:hypothetical protein